MYGKLICDRLGRFLCDKCGLKLGRYIVRPSHELYYFINAPSCKRKLIRLCLECTREFSEMASGERRE